MSNQRIVRLAAVIVLLACSATAQAQSSPKNVEQVADLQDSPVVPVPPGPSRWYGWEILLAELGGVGMFAGGVALDSSALTGVGAVTYFAAPFLIHRFNQAPGLTVLCDMGLRLGLPLAGLLVAAAIPGRYDRGESANPDGDLVNLVIGAGVGLAAATLIDVTVLSWTHPGAPKNLRASLGPMPLKDGGGVMLGGVF